MLRKDSLMKQWWDPAFKRLIESRDYRGICNDVDDPTVHGTYGLLHLKNTTAESNGERFTSN